MRYVMCDTWGACEYISYHGRQKEEGDGPSSLLSREAGAETLLTLRNPSTNMYFQGPRNTARRELPDAVEHVDVLPVHVHVREA